MLHNDAMGSLSADVSLPTLDGAKWLSGSESDRQEFANGLLKSLKRHGFAKLVNHGISDDAVREMYRWVTAIMRVIGRLMLIALQNREFFDLSVESKSNIEHKPTALQPQRGWSCVGVERSAKLNWGKTPEQKFQSQGLQDAKVSNLVLSRLRLINMCYRSIWTWARQMTPSTATSGRKKRICQVSEHAWRTTTIYALT